MHVATATLFVASGLLSGPRNELHPDRLSFYNTELSQRTLKLQFENSASNLWTRRSMTTVKLMVRTTVLLRPKRSNIVGHGCERASIMPLSAGSALPEQ